MFAFLEVIDRNAGYFRQRNGDATPPPPTVGGGKTDNSGKTAPPPAGIATGAPTVPAHVEPLPAKALVGHVVRAEEFLAKHLRVNNARVGSMPDNLSKPTTIASTNKSYYSTLNPWLSGGADI